MKRNQMVAICLTLLLAAAAAARADEVTDWNQTLFRSGLMTNPTTSPLVMTRVAAIFSAAVFDAVNDGRYAPIVVAPGLPAGASRRAAAVEAAYASLLALLPASSYPSLKTALDGRRTASLADITEDDGEAAVADGIAWGHSVAQQVVAARSTDGFTAPPPPLPIPVPFLGGTAVGEWRPTPPGFLPGAGPQFAYMTPWVIPSPSQFRPGGPPSLTSARWAQDFNETKSMGSLTSASRTADQTVYAVFWNSTTASSLWNGVAVHLLDAASSARVPPHHDALLRNARVLALLNLAIADAAIACWDAKYYYVAWRPVTAIPLGDTDGNPATDPDPAWLPLLVTPNHPEYPSGHSTLSGAASAVLARVFGLHTHFAVHSDLALGVVRPFHGFHEALEEIKNARIFAGIHFRSACDDGTALGDTVGSYVLAHSMLPVH
ncbi:MAG TPA: vanadium-dependent haloperoxidase [Vicinamibacteria bacterium]|nr:vanadium-dependent haloperoxidase [Vicinamibacteria bacterium]